MGSNIDLTSYIRVASACPTIKVADINFNINEIISTIDKAAEVGTEIIVFPELSITGYTCGDLFRQRILIDTVNTAIDKICEYSAKDKAKNMLIIVGAPIEVNATLYNCGVAIVNGKVVCIVPKLYLPNYNEFYERRWFAPAMGIKNQAIKFNGEDVRFGTDIIISHNGTLIGIELCEDLWTAIPPSCHSALAGAEIICNLSATDEVYGKHRGLVKMIEQQSARCKAAYIYSSAGYGESTSDMVHSGNAIIVENGQVLAKSPRFTAHELSEIADIDLDIIRGERMLTSSWADCLAVNRKDFEVVTTGSNPTEKSELMRKIDAHPFVPADKQERDHCCDEVLQIQTLGLMRRLQITYSKNLVVGISGGLDSTLALLVAVRAFDRLGLDRKGIIGITMPGFGTSVRTRSNAHTIMERLGITTLEIHIGKAVEQHFSDIDHPATQHDITYENSQARERTQILMDYANKVNGLVLGTGDLSELALGWCTYNGDHMSMYAINAGVPKTLVKALVAYEAQTTYDATLSASLMDIVDTPISPELVPSQSDQRLDQVTEDIVGPYELHDFFIYNALRYAYSPIKIFRLAQIAFEDSYNSETIKRWLKIFYRRFFTQQFKRSCMPDGPKVVPVSLSPRADWRMPSDASAKLWLDECETL